MAGQCVDRSGEHEHVHNLCGPFQSIPYTIVVYSCIDWIHGRSRSEATQTQILVAHCCCTRNLQLHHIRQPVFNVKVSICDILVDVFKVSKH